MNSPAKTEETKGEPKEPFQQERKPRTAPVYVYLLILFAAAFAMLLLAYLIQQRNEAVATSACYLNSIQSVPAIVSQTFSRY